MTAVTSVYKNFPQLRAVTLWAGCIGLFQSLVWIGLTITGIAAYNCAITYPDSTDVTDKSITEFTFYEIYFRSSICTNTNYPGENDDNTNFINAINHLNGTKTVLTAEQLFIWICVYLGVCVVWFMMSVLLLTNVRGDQMRVTNVILYLWVFVTLSISAMDLALGVIFGIDYGRFAAQADKQTFLANGAMTIFISAQIVSMSMMIMAFKGFILWIINIAFVCYLFTETFLINKAVTSANTSYFNRAYQNTNGSLESVAERNNDRAPIQAFETKNDIIIAQGPFEIEEQTTTELNFEPIERASRLSMDNLQERRLRNIDSYQQYPPVNSQTSVNSNDPPFPVPDYTPPMPRSSRLYNGQLKNSRYQ
ncbi:hypothetical protein ACFFRR_011597 [Megaselia abdita]